MGSHEVVATVPVDDAAHRSAPRRKSAANPMPYATRVLSRADHVEFVIANLQYSGIRRLAATARIKHCSIQEDTAIVRIDVDNGGVHNAGICIRGVDAVGHGFASGYRVSVVTIQPSQVSCRTRQTRTVMAVPEALYFTNDEDANRLLAESPLALLIGLALYQQVPIEKAFVGPLVLQERFGSTLEAASIAGTDLESIETIFKETPAIHRFPGSMAKRVHALCTYLSEEYDGDPTPIWTHAGSAADVIRSLKKLPGFGDYKAKVAFTVLVKRFGVEAEGWKDATANFPTVADIDGPGQLDDFKARKKAWKDS